MEIRSVKNEEVKYPTINQISQKELKAFIPSKWIKLGLTSFMFEILIKQKVYAISPNMIIESPGVDIYYNPIYEYVRIGCDIVSLISILMFVISGIMMISTKLKAKKQKSKTGISKKIKILFIISIILLIASRIGILIVKSMAPFMF